MKQNPRVDEIFNNALEQPPEKRAAYLDQACADAPDVRERVEQLLALHGEAGDFLERRGSAVARDFEGLAGGRPSVRPTQPKMITVGQTLGSRYRIEAQLGRGGMGEVWRAFDLKLRVDVALKALHADLFSSDQARELLRREVRTARDVISPNVCRVFDLVVEDDTEFVSMEFIDGRTFHEVLQERAPLDVREAGEIMAQLLAGLEAIHAAGLVHRDVKPANVMITRTGRVVLMDFGLAKGLADVKEGSIAGTPAYMAPEQARGAAIDARADIFAAGVILAEMLTSSDRTSREALWSGVRRNPPKLPETPWEDVLRRAVAWDASQRFETARAMARALEDVTLHTEGAEDRTPYPGLHSFTEADAEYFFGREAEVEAVWKKLQRQQMIAVVGPSGAGKTSFLCAGLVPAAPGGWACLVTAPGSSPFKSLAHVLVPEIAGDAEAMRQILDFEEPGIAVAIVARWRARHHETLLILDQFEELFTLNPPEVQARFANLLRDLAFEADVHVLLSMRDDFLFRCQEHEALQPILADLTLMGTLTGSALRRALVQPALACGYRFEADALVDEMIDEVHEERGALPPLAFAAAQMWERRDRASGTLTRDAYQRIGGVGGALAQHAESTLERIGAARMDVVRELFRNLVTSQGTRAARTTEELLSVFEDREVARAVLDQLVDARLLTSFELPGDGGDGARGHRIELVHESLLRSWPRLVRWQTQDADGAQLRDQLRQAAHLWEERSRSVDLLWTGTAYRDFELWRERYPGGLSESEESFAEAMEARSLRQRRRRRLAVTGTFFALLMVLVVVGTLWQRSDRVARLSEAQRFRMLAQENLKQDNTLALALATASLEREDDPLTRRLALNALGRGPVRFVKEVPDTLYFAASACLSPDGEWLATVDEDGVLLWPRDGGSPRSLECEETSTPYVATVLDFHPDGTYLVAARAPKGRLRQQDPGLRLVSLWTVPEGRHLGTWPAPDSGAFDPFVRGNPPQLIAAFCSNPEADPTSAYQWLRYSLGSKEAERLGVTDPPSVYSSWFWVDPSGRLLLHGSDNLLYVSRVDGLDEEAGVLVGRHESRIESAVFSEDGERIVSGDSNGVIKVWLRRTDGTYGLESTHDVGDVARVKGFDPRSSRMLYVSGHEGAAASRVLTLDREQSLAEPTEFLPTSFEPGWPFFTPEEDWLVFSWCDERFGRSDQVWFYPLRERQPKVLRAWPSDLEFEADVFADGGSSLLGRAPGGELWLCSLVSMDTECRLLWRNPVGPFVMGGKDPQGRHALVNGFEEPKAWVIPIDGTEPTSFGVTQGCLGGVARDPHRPRVAVGGSYNRCKTMPDEPIIHVHDLMTGAQQTLEAPGECGFYGMWFLPGDRLLSFGREGLLVWDLASGAHDVLSERNYFSDSDMSGDGRFLVVASSAGWELWDVDHRSMQSLPLPEAAAGSVALSSDASLVAVATTHDEILVLPRDADAPFVLSGHEGTVTAVWISPDNQKIYSAGEDGTVRIWPRPRGRPFHGLPREEFLEYLRAQTNMRVVADVEAEEGYHIVYERFPGWQGTPP